MIGKDLYEAIDQVKDKYIDEVYNSQNKNNISLSKKKLYLLLVAATMVIAMLTACAAEVYKWDGRLSQVLNLSSEQAVNFVFYSDIKYTPNVIKYSLDKEVSGLLNTLKVEDITITPISLTVKASSESKVTFWDVDTREHEKDFVSAVILKDGTKMELSDSSTGSNIFNTVSYKTMFKEIINPKDIAAIEFFEKDRVSLADLEYTTGVQSILSDSQMAKIRFEIGIFISLISMAVSAISALHFCKSDMYKSFEKIQAKKQRKGKEYIFDAFCSSHKKMLRTSEIFYVCYSIILFLGACRLTFLIITNWFVTMTVFMDALCIGLIFLMVATIRESRKKRKILGKV